MNYSSATPTPTPTYPHILPYDSSPRGTAPAPEHSVPDDAASTTPSGRGQPRGYSERVLQMLKDVIRRLGLSDAAAAESLGMSAATVSGWKREFPEFAQALLQARQECRIFHLEIITRSAAAEDGRGWRAAAWMLERLFPGDYSPRMSERFAHRNFEDQTRERERSAALDEKLRQQEAARNARSAQARAAAEAKSAAPASDDALHNVQNSGPERDAAQGHAGSMKPGAPAEDPGAASESALHNVQNSTCSSDSGQARPGSHKMAAAAEDGRTASEEALHNVQNNPSAGGTFTGGMPGSAQAVAVIRSRQSGLQW